MEIEKGDAILVVNMRKHGVDGYVGANVLMEIAVAFCFDKKVFLLHPTPTDATYATELSATDPVVLNGDLKKISF